jgi:hypothetical protein
MEDPEISVNKKRERNSQNEQSPNWRKFAQSGVDVMITIFCDFCQFSAKKLAFFPKTNVMIKYLHYLALFRVKNAKIFAIFFCQNIFKIITSVPGRPIRDLTVSQTRLDGPNQY